MKSRIYSVFAAVILTLSFSGIIFCTSCDSTVYRWEMATSWTADNLAYSDGAVAICERVKELSDGRLIIEPHPAGELTDAFSVFDTISSGQFEVGFSWPAYWREKDPAFELFSSIPNNMVPQEWLVWLYGPSKGIDLWRELYDEYDLIPFPGALSGPEFGFFTNKPLRNIDDFQGMRLRAPGMAADVLTELGAIPVVVPQGEILNTLENGELDGFEYGPPAIDWGIGFNSTITPYVTLPGWHQPSAMYEVFVNKDTWNKLPHHLQEIFEAACKEVSMVDFFAQVEGLNAEYQREYLEGGMQVSVLDNATMQKISEITAELADAQAATNSFYAKVLKSQRDFKADYRTWETWSDYQIYQ